MYNDNMALSFCHCEREYSKNSYCNKGVDLLRVIMCFEVILYHFYNNDAKIFFTNFAKLRIYAVPCFMVLAFYFSASIYINRSYDKLKKRLCRLVLPHIIWSIISWIVVGMMDNKCSYYKLINQIILGRPLNVAMWFQVDLILITLFISLIFWLKKKPISFMIMVCLTCLLIQYYEICLSLRNFPEYNGHTIGRLLEMIPYAGCGVLLYKYDVLNKIKKNANIFTWIICVYCKMKLPKVEKQNWTLLQVHFGQSCKGDF